jgi:hypothetical protein
MCNIGLDSCTNQTQREQVVDREISHCRATTLYVPLPAFMAGIDVSGEARARTFGKQLKIPERFGAPMATLKHLEISLQISETGESRLQRARRVPTYSPSRGAHLVAYRLRRWYEAL